MTEQLQPKAQDNFLAWLIWQQLQFETERVGTDGSLFEVNTLEHGLVRGIIGEAQEALEALKEGDLEAVKGEIIDVIVFLGSVLAHAGMEPLEVVEKVAHTMRKTHQKYSPDHFKDRTVREAMQYSRDQWSH